MQVIVVILLLTITSLCIKRKYLKVYIYIAISFLSSMYFFFNPPEEFDLYRYYELFDAINSSNTGEMYEVYSSRYCVFMLFFFLLSSTTIKSFIPFTIGCLYYYFSLNIILLVNREFKNEPCFYNSLRIGFILLLMLSDFLSISGLRTVLASILFAFFLLLEFNDKINRKICI